MSGPLTRPPLDPEIARAVQERQGAIVTSMSRTDIERVRGLEKPLTREVATHHGAFARNELTVPGTGGRPDVPVVTYSPVSRSRVVPVLLYLHGGGLVAGSADADMDAIADLAHETGCAAVSVEYRLAPEHPYPAALEDAITVLEWLGAGDGPPCVDPTSIIMIGVSAGGGLAAATALHSRDHQGSRIAGLLLVCPMLDHRSNSASARQMAGLGSWDASANATAWSAYLGDRAATAYASPSLATVLCGLPPTFIDVGSAETFRDECVDFASRIWEHGGDAELHVWPGGVHGFDLLAPWAQLSRAARAQRVAWLRRLLARTGTSRTECT